MQGIARAKGSPDNPCYFGRSMFDGRAYGWVVELTQRLADPPFKLVSHVSYGLGTQLMGFASVVFNVWAAKLVNADAVFGRFCGCSVLHEITPNISTLLHLPSW